MHLTHTRRIPLFIVAAALLCAADLWAATSAGFLQHTSVFAFAITADLLVGLPLLFYGLIVRPLRLAPITVIPVLLLAIVIAGVIVPLAGQTYLSRVKLLVPLLELTLLAAVVWRTRGIVRAYRVARREEPYLIDALETSVQATFRLARQNAKEQRPRPTIWLRASRSMGTTTSANYLAEGITFNGNYNCKVFSGFSAVLHIELEARRFENRRP